MRVIRDPDWLLLSMVGLGFAWASIIALPYAMLANSLPARKMGVNMGIFNIFIVIPQLLAASVLSWLLDIFAGGDPTYTFVIAAAGWILAGLSRSFRASGEPATFLVTARGSARPAHRRARAPRRCGPSTLPGASR